MEVKDALSTIPRTSSTKARSASETVTEEESKPATQGYVDGVVVAVFLLLFLYTVSTNACNVSRIRDLQNRVTELEQKR